MPTKGIKSRVREYGFYASNSFIMIKIDKEIANDERILKEMIAATKTGMVGQFLVLAFVVVVCISYVPTPLLAAWAAIQSVNLVIRYKILDRFFYLPSKSSTRQRRKAYRAYLVSLAVTSLLWAAMAFFIFYLPEERQMLLAIFALGLTFGATMSLGAATQIYLLFVLPINLALFGIFLYLGIRQDREDLLLLDLFLPVALLFATKAARMHLFDYRAILEKKDQLTKQKRLYEYRATHDLLTNLPNRQLFYETLEKEILATRLKGKSFALFFIDLDDFKYVNDRFGHHAGDQLLKLFAQRLKNTVRKSDFVARLAGDEFVVLAKGISNPQEARHIADAIEAIAQRPFSLGETRLRLHTSVGYAIFPEDALTAKELMQHADSEMYRNKKMRKKGKKYEENRLTPARQD